MNGMKNGKLYFHMTHTKIHANRMTCQYTPIVFTKHACHCYPWLIILNVSIYIIWHISTHTLNMACIWDDTYEYTSKSFHPIMDKLHKNCIGKLRTYVYKEIGIHNINMKTTNKHHMDIYHIYTMNIHTGGGT